MIRNQIEVLSFDERFALIEQRNRIAKIFGHNQRGLASYLK
jgi:hypothetical protein